MRRIMWYAILLALPLLLWGCSSDDSNPPQTGTLTGHVIFHGQWPDSGAVQLSIFRSWNADNAGCTFCGEAPGGPPAYYTPAAYFHDPNPNNGDGPDTVEFTITGITLDTYNAVAVGWRNPAGISDFNCDEPTIGLFGAEPPPYYTGHADSLPTAVAFTSDHPEVNVNVDAYFTLLPWAGCGGRGRVEGIVRVPGDWPPEGLLVMLTTFQASAWQPVMQQPSGYFHLATSADSVFHFTPQFGTYYISLWNYVQPPATTYWYGSYGTDTRVSQGHPVVTDARSDGIAISTQNPLVGDVVVNGNAPAPHWISGTVTFNGTRPQEGLLVLVSTFMFTPEHPPTGAPWGYFMIGDPNETLYALSGMPEGTYYVSLWNTAQPPNSVFYGAYGYTAGSDTDPDPVVISSTVWGANSINITGQP
jgi:hypothetical protein